MTNELPVPKQATIPMRYPKGIHRGIALASISCAVIVVTVIGVFLVLSGSAGDERKPALSPEGLGGPMAREVSVDTAHLGARIGEVVEEGQLRLILDSALIGGPYLYRRKFSDDKPFKADFPHEYLVVRLTAQNTSPDRILIYEAWGNFDGFGTTPALMDDLGNSYRQMNFGSYEIAEGATDNRIRPRQRSQDILIFEEALAHAKEFKLELPKPGHSIFHPKYFKFRFSRSETK